MSSSKSLVEPVDFSAKHPPGNEERFSGYGVMGLPFASGHILSLRRFEAFSRREGYMSVWHMNPEGH